MTSGSIDPREEILASLEQAIADASAHEIEDLLGALLGFGAAQMPSPAAPLSRRRPARADVATYRIRVDLKHASPPIWRRLELRSDLTLEAVHAALQAAFGWWDYHLHRFALGTSVYGWDAEVFLCPAEVEEGDSSGAPAAEVRLDETLAEPGDVLRYVYDYGDDWELALKLEAVRPREADAPAAVCVGGRRAAPPEDCGGLRHAEDLAEVLPDPAYFDPEEVNQALARSRLPVADVPPVADVLPGAGVATDPRLVGLLRRLRSSAVGDDLSGRLERLSAEPAPSPDSAAKADALRPFLWLLERAGDEGMPLTSAGYLRPADVSALADLLPSAADWPGTRNREVQTAPVLAFREAVRGLGLLRKHRGRLVLTKAGQACRGNPEALWRSLADRLPAGEEGSPEHTAGLVALLLAATSAGSPLGYDVIATALTDLGWRQGAGEPVSAYAVQHDASDTLAVLENLGTTPPPPGPRAPLRHHRPVSAAAAALARDTLVRTG